MNKILRKILKDYLPDNLITDQKKGFALPISYWMKNELKDWVNDTLTKENLNRYNLFNYDSVNNLKEQHFDGKFNNEHKLWSLIQFNEWFFFVLRTYKTIFKLLSILHKYKLLFSATF